MNPNESWLIIDTETSGLRPPIYAVEIAAQRMRGWEPDGEPFRVLLNHNVPIEPGAQALHGYSRDYLRKNGAAPADGHAAFRLYAENLPVVAHNLPFDWDRVLLPEWERLGLPNAGRKGFCSLTLARRVIPETPNYKLETLNIVLALTPSKLHGAMPDVQALVKLCCEYYAPRLNRGGIDGFENVAIFARKTPISKCRSIVQIGIDHTQRPQGEELQSKPSVAAVEKVTQMLQNIMADGTMTTDEFLGLVSWLQDFGPTDDWPIGFLAETVETIICDGVATAREQTQLEEIIQELLKGFGK